MTATMARRSAAKSNSSSDEKGSGGTMLAIFFIALLIPIHPVVAGQRMDPYRVLLLLLFVPYAISLAKGKAGRFTLADGMLFGFAFWIVLTLVKHHGGERFAYGMILGVELFGGYMVGRLLIRSSSDYRRFVKYFLTALLVLFPFAFYELKTGHMVIAEYLGKVFPVSEKFDESRYGLSRVQAVFPHSILYGLFCSVGAANAFYLYRERIFRMLPRVGLVTAMTYMSLSSAPLLSIGLQGFIILWGKATGNRWKLLFWLVSSLYIFLTFASNRGPIIILIETLTLNPSTAWWRVYIWQYGIQNVYANPVFGIGLGNWARPSWLASTVDNFWLLTAMRHGIPGIFLLGGGIAFNLVSILRVKTLTPEQNNIRTGYMVALVGLLFTLCTVHVWDAMAVFVMFYVGAGAFLFTTPPEVDKGQVDEAAITRRSTASTGPQRGPDRPATPDRGQSKPPRTIIRHSRVRSPGVAAQTDLKDDI